MSIDHFIDEWRSHWSDWWTGFSTGFAVWCVILAAIFSAMSFPHNDWAIGSETGGMVLAWVCGYWWGKRR